MHPLRPSRPTGNLAVLRRRFVVASVALLACAGCQARFQAMPNGSMEPTIRTGERLKIDRTAYRAHLPLRGQVIALRPPEHPERVWILRIVGLPGERIRVEGGRLFADGLALDFPWEPLTRGSSQFTLEQPTLPMRVPHDEYFVLGDNAREANDSRVWGTVPFSCILGQVVPREDEAPDRFNLPVGRAGKSR